MFIDSAPSVRIRMQKDNYNVASQWNIVNKERISTHGFLGTFYVAIMKVSCTHEAIEYMAKNSLIVIQSFIFMNIAAQIANVSEGLPAPKALLDS